MQEERYNYGGKEAQEDNSTPAVYAEDVGYSSCLPFLPLFCTRVVFLIISIPALFLYFLRVHPSPPEMKISKKLSYPSLTNYSTRTTFILLYTSKMTKH